MHPKITFTVGKVSDYLSMIRRFIASETFKSGIFKIFPDLDEALSKSPLTDRGLKKYFTNKEKEKKDELENVRKNYEESWKKIEMEAFSVLEDIHETSWEEKHKHFTARVTLMPVCPRYLDHAAFDLYFGFKIPAMLTAVLHELSHFIFFEKIKQVYPHVERYEFESPHLVWKLSEILPAIILNDPRMQEVFKVDDEKVVYKSIQTLEIKGKNLLKTLQEFYDGRKNMEDFIKRSYEYLLEHKAELKKLK